MACGKPRELKKGTVIIGGAGPLPGAGVLVGGSADAVTVRNAQASAGRGASFFFRTVGALSMAAGVLGAGAAAALLWPVGTAAAVVAAAAVGVTGVGLGAAAIVAGNRSRSAAADRQRTARELAILQLAEEKGGALTATDVARELHIRPDEADAALTAMVDGSRIDAVVLPEGIVRYEFREMQPELAPPKVRVATGEPMTAEEEEEALEALREELGQAPREMER